MIFTQAKTPYPLTYLSPCTSFPFFQKSEILVIGLGATGRGVGTTGAAERFSLHNALYCASQASRTERPVVPAQPPVLPVARDRYE